MAPGYPKPISKEWPGLPGNIDAAFTYKNGKTYFFKGKQYWRYNGKKVDGDYPRDISEGFAGIPDSLDAALVWSGNGKIYFYKGTHQNLEGLRLQKIAIDVHVFCYKITYHFLTAVIHCNI